MIVDRIQITETKTGRETSSSIIAAMPKLPDGYAWVTFVEDISGRAIPAGENITLIQLDGDPSNDGFKKVRTQVRKALAPLSVKVEYENVYENKMPPVHRDMDWFARNL
jgi:hypothetical protein